MSSEHKHERFRSALREAAAEFVQREIKTEGLLTVTDCSVSPDFKYATIYFTVLPDEKESNTLHLLKRERQNLRNYVESNSRLTTIPFLDFAIDRRERDRQSLERTFAEAEKLKDA